jgi:hypothetical protein
MMLGIDMAFVDFGSISQIGLGVGVPLEVVDCMGLCCQSDMIRSKQAVMAADFAWTNLLE